MPPKPTSKRSKKYYDQRHIELALLSDEDDDEPPCSLPEPSEVNRQSISPPPGRVVDPYSFFPEHDPEYDV
jgi:hypothetical protein